MTRETSKPGARPILADERSLLEACLSECKRQLDHFRAEGNQLREAMAEADLNDLLDRLRELTMRGARNG